MSQSHLFSYTMPSLHPLEGKIVTLLQGMIVSVRSLLCLQGLAQQVLSNT